MSSPSALEGIKVVELSHAIAGPQCGQILADHGADVIKIEPATGDSARNAFPLIDGDSIYYACHNRGKRAIVLDLKSDEGRARLHELAARADIVLTNYSVDVPARNGWDYETLRASNPRLIMVHITGFGSTGADRGLRAYDGIIQAMSGIPSYSGTPESGPVFVGAFVADHVAAYHAVIATLMALQRRQLTGEGEFVDVSMLRAYSATSAHGIGAALSGQPLKQQGNKVNTAVTNTWEALDGFVVLAPLGDAKWVRFCRAIGRDDWAANLGYRDAVVPRRDEAEKGIAEWCRRWTRAEIVAQMRAVDIPCAAVVSAAEAAQHAIDVESGDIVTVTGPHGGQIGVPAPLTTIGLTQSSHRWEVAPLGQHTAEVLDELAAARAVRASKATED